MQLFLKKLPTKSTTLFFEDFKLLGGFLLREGTPSKARTRGWNYSDIVATLPEGCCPLRLETPCAVAEQVVRCWRENLEVHESTLPPIIMEVENGSLQN